jgi:hypothetical protein
VGDPATLDDIPNPHSNQVTGPQLAVDCEIEQGKVPYMTAELKAYANRPDFIPLQRGFLTGDLSLVPGHAHTRARAQTLWSLRVALNFSFSAERRSYVVMTSRAAFGQER